MYIKQSEKYLAELLVHIKYPVRVRYHFDNYHYYDYWYFTVLNNSVVKYRFFTFSAMMCY